MIDNAAGTTFVAEINGNDWQPFGIFRPLLNIELFVTGLLRLSTLKYESSDKYINIRKIKVDL